MNDDINPSDTIAIDSVDTFARAIAHWHGNVLARAKHYHNVPDGTEITIEEDGKERTITLTGDALLAFKAGLDSAIQEFALMPFIALSQPEVANEPASPAH